MRFLAQIWGLLGEHFWSTPEEPAIFNFFQCIQIVIVFFKIYLLLNASIFLIFVKIENLSLKNRKNREFSSLSAFIRAQMGKRSILVERNFFTFSLRELRRQRLIENFCFLGSFFCFSLPLRAQRVLRGARART